MLFLELSGIQELFSIKRYNVFSYEKNWLFTLTLSVYQKALIRTFYTSFLTTQQPLGLHSTRAQTQKVFCTQKLGLNVCLKISGIQK